MAQRVLDDFRRSQLGAITLELPPAPLHSLEATL